MNFYHALIAEENRPKFWVGYYGRNRDHVREQARARWPVEKVGVLTEREFRGLTGDELSAKLAE